MPRTSAFPLPDLTGKIYVITGANSGIGFEAARALARKGAHVVLACRNVDRGQAARAKILAEAPDAQLEVLELDLADLASVRDFAALIRARESKLHGLINNAGIMAIARQLTADGFEMQLGVNHFGHFALTGLLLDRLLATPGARIVNVASQASKLGRMRWDDLDGERSYTRWGQYGRSKLANLLFTFELARRLSELRLDARSIACHPGYAATNLQFVAADQDGSRLTRKIMELGNAVIAQSAEAGALPTLYAAVSPDAQSGDYIGPQERLGWHGFPGKLRAMRAAYNPEAMRKLWDISVQRTSVDFAALAPPGSRPVSGPARGPATPPAPAPQ
ncbi:MAG TPA: oxidoreductase [Polyangiales bacterium]|nr:oxidoreductase [Polyangiales bacterium]